MRGLLYHFWLPGMLYGWLYKQKKVFFICVDYLISIEKIEHLCYIMNKG